MKVKRLPIFALAMCVMLVPFEKISTYVDWPISFTLKVHFILSPFVIFVFFKHVLLARHKQRIWAFMFLSISIVAAIFLSTVISGDNERISAVMFRAYSLLLMLSVFFIASSRDDVVILLKSYFVTGFISALYGYVQFVQFYLGYDTSFFLDGWLALPERIGYATTTAIPVVGGMPRLTGFNYDPNVYAIVLLVAMTSGYSLQLLTNNQKWFYSALIMIFPFVMSLSRASYLFAIAIYFLVPLILAKRQKVRFAHFFIVGFAVIWFVVSWDAIVQRFSSEGSLSTHYHVMFGNAAIQLGMEKPIVGHGIDTFENAFLDSKYNPGISRANAHSLPLTVFFESGSLGVVTYLCFIFLIIYTIARGIHRETINRTSWRYVVIPLGSLCLMLLIHNTINNYFHTEFFSMYLGLVLAAVTVTTPKLSNSSTLNKDII